MVQLKAVQFLAGFPLMGCMCDREQRESATALSGIVTKLGPSLPSMTYCCGAPSTQCVCSVHAVRIFWSPDQTT